MRLRTGFYILLSVLLSTGLYSCLGDSPEQEYLVSLDAQLISFSLSHDSLPDLAKAAFSIDQVTGEIYNYDSLPYQTIIPDTVTVKYASGSGVSSIIVADPSVAGGKRGVQSGDTINVTNQQATFTVYSPSDSTVYKIYNLKINVHQIDPDSVHYAAHTAGLSFLASENKTVKYNGAYYAFTASTLSTSTNLRDWTTTAMSASFPTNVIVSSIQATPHGFVALAADGKLYLSANAILWSELTLSHSVVAVLGYLNAFQTQKEGLAVVIEKEGVNTFAFLPELYSVASVAIETGEALPPNFPLTDISSFNDMATVYSYLTIVGGTANDKTNVWATQDGCYWAELSGGRGVLPAITGGNAIQYNHELWFLGGRLADGSYNIDN
jgi:hypothetical protein